MKIEMEFEYGGYGEYGCMIVIREGHDESGELIRVCEECLAEGPRADAELELAEGSEAA
jgi:hypothetical protein